MIGTLKIGEQTRVWLSLPWFSVWVDFDPWTLLAYREREDFIEMTVYALQDKAYLVTRALVKDACHEASHPTPAPHSVRGVAVRGG